MFLPLTKHMIRKGKKIQNKILADKKTASLEDVVLDK